MKVGSLVIYNAEGGPLGIVLKLAVPNENLCAAYIFSIKQVVHDYEKWFEVVL